ncbi:NUDIX domain-containing protein [Ktedonosporobacter rubrisoli]|uniref:NUDIX domain-containing protein n=1 Tax=Ktedonosporobacter rubrisoli TaxID=2509675 RepID=UPI001A919142|nr:NUDIX domain-containing protein [Ktedonosporobacter rubrisoli]
MDTKQDVEGIRPTHVVTCFLMRNDGTEPHILTVRRSQKVGSYHGHWAGISGFVEPGVTPEEQAFTEIREETSLSREQVRMLRRGKIVEYVDVELKRHFYVHPFLFYVLTPAAIKTDWEATEMRWIVPAELHNLTTVPRLPEAYESASQGEEVP